MAGGNSALEMSEEAEKAEESISLPICYLVKEQAKSLVSIQELQRRLDHVQIVQDNVVAAILEFRNYLHNSSALRINCMSTSQCDLEVKDTERLKCKEVALESDKQDSGLDSEQASLQRAAHSSESGDELIQLLDEIGQRSVVLQKLLASAEEEKQNPKLPTETRPQRTSSGPSNAPLQQQHITHRRPQPTARVVDSAAVSEVLRPGVGTLELQRTALVHLVECAVLQARLAGAQAALRERDRLEAALREESRLLMMENRELHLTVNELRGEVRTLGSKMDTMEQAFHSAITRLSPHSQEDQSQTFPKHSTLHKPDCSKSKLLTSMGMEEEDRVPSAIFRRSSTPRFHEDSHRRTTHPLQKVEGAGAFPFKSMLQKLNSGRTFGAAKEQGPSDSVRCFKEDLGPVKASASREGRCKNKNIQQRIQDILDKLVAESEDAA